MMNTIQPNYRLKWILETSLVLWLILNLFAIAEGATTAALWQGDKKGAVSITFDDGLASQFEKAFPALQQRGLKATFNIISGQANTSAILAISEDGQEIASHTVTHTYLTKLSNTQLVSELSQSQLYLQQLTGQKVDTIAYPYGDYNTSVMNAVRNYYIAGRSADSGYLNSSSPTSDQFYRLYAIGPHSRYGSGDENAIAGMKYWADRAVSEQKWFVELLHGIDDGYDAISSQAFATHLDYLLANEPNLWVAPMGEVAEYIYERNTASITTVAQDSNVIELNLHCGLDSRFDTPITLLTDCPAGWAASDIYVKQGQIEQLADVVSKNGRLYIMYDAVPDAGTILLSVVSTIPPTYYTITASSGPNGAISPSGDIQKVDGSSQLFTAVPNQGYQVDKWFVNDIAVQAGGDTYNLALIHADNTVYVTFKPSSVTAETTTALWQGDKKGVVSLTFDDELSTQYQYAFPILTQHGIRATFYIVTSQDASPAMIQALAADGQEIASHSVTHPYLTTLSSSQLVNELSQSQSYLQQISGQKVATFAYPYGDYNTNVLNAVKNYYIAARSAILDQLNSSSPTLNELYTLYTVVPRQIGADDASVIAYLRSQTDMAVSQQKWVIETFHGVRYGYEPISTAALSTHLDYLAANEPNLWVAPMGEVAEYIYERNGATITTVAQDSNVIKLNLQCGLDSRFTTPLTLLTDCPAGWATSDIYVKQGQTSQVADVISKNGNLYIMYDALPDGGTIELSVSQVVPPTYYTITASAGPNGTISPSGSMQKLSDSSQIFTAAPNTGYVVDKWYLDSVSVQTGGTAFTLDNIQTNHAVSVTFGLLPLTPASITYPTNSSTGQYTVSWASSAAATSYQLERSNNGGSTWTQIYSGGNTSYSENIGIGSYRYRVKATNAFGSSDWKAGTSDCVVTVPPSTPISISYPSSSSSGQYTVNWSSSNGATSYQLERSSDGGGTWTQVYSGANTSYSENIANGSYRYRVRASNSAGSSNWITGTFDCVVAQLPAIPTGVSASDGTYADRVRVSWNASSGATGYEIWRYTSNKSNKASKIAEVTSLSYDDTAVTSRTTYWYWVKAKNSAGTSNFSRGDSGKTSR